MRAFNSSSYRSLSFLSRSYATTAFPEKVEYMDKVNEHNETIDKPFLPWQKLPKHESTHAKMRLKQLRRMKRGLEAYHPVNNTLVSMKLDAYSRERRTRFSMILFDSVVERGGFFSHNNYKKFLKAVGIRGGCFEESQIIFNHYKQSYPTSEYDMTVFNQMIQVCRGNPEQALKYYQSLIENDQMIPNTFTFNYLLQSILKPYRRHTILKNEEVKEMNQERNDWGNENQHELRDYADQIINLIHDFDSVIFANPYIQYTLCELVKLPVLSDFEPLKSIIEPSLLKKETQIVTKRPEEAISSLSEAFAASYKKIKLARSKEEATPEQLEILKKEAVKKIEKDLL